MPNKREVTGSSPVGCIISLIRIVVITPRCGRGNLGSIPRWDIYGFVYNYFFV